LPSSALSGADVADPTLGHPLRGVSVHHLSTEFISQVEATGLSGDSKVYDIEPVVIRPRGQDTWCPRDGQLGAAYVDAIHGEDHAGMATIMLSYTWGYRIGDVVDSLVEYCNRERLDPKRVYVWICCLCINQHKVIRASKVGQSVPFESFQKEFGSRVRGIGHVVLLMAPWHDPFYLTRVWCVYELYTAAVENVQTTIIMPPGEEFRFREALCDKTSMDEVWKNLGKVDVENAKASVNADRVAILAMIKDGPGFIDFNACVVGKLKNWMVESSEACLKNNFDTDSSDISDSAFLGICQNVNKLLRWTGEYERAAELLEPAIKRAGNADSEDLANLLRQVGIIRRRQRNASGAKEAFEQAKGITERLGTLETSDGALLLINLGISEFESGGDPFNVMFAARDLTSKLGLLDTNVGGLLFKWLGVFEFRRGNFQKADEFYKSAWSVYEKTGALPQLGKLKLDMGELKQAQGDLESALALYKEALESQKKFGLLDSVESRQIVTSIEDVEQRLAVVDGTGL